MAQCQRCRVSGATGANDYTPTPHEWNKNSQSNYKTREYITRHRVEIPVTTADFYFPLETRPLLVFVDGQVHLGTTQMAKDEDLRSLLRKRGYRILELCYTSYSEKKRDQLYEEIRANLTKLVY
jgi:very-short-patch-repair endonuclease